MNRYLIVILAIAILAAPVMAMIIEEPKDIGDEKPVLYAESAVKYSPTKTSFVQGIITSIGEIIGIIEPKEFVVDTIDVEVNGKVIANIPKGSKFEGMKIHEVCLMYQYGTDGWYWCEVSL